jgi:GNAT superfamily N-acetyltransferase
MSPETKSLEIAGTNPSLGSRVRLAVRRAGPQDASALAALFHIVYQSGSHPFQTVAGIEAFLSQPCNFQILAERGKSVVASMAMTYNSWNNSFELGRALTHPEYRGHGLAGHLMQKVVNLVAQQRLGDLILGFPRVRRIVDLCANLDRPIIVAGHDAGRNVANGTRETHVIVVGVPHYARFSHVAPPVPELLSWTFLLEQLYARLGLFPIPGHYPSDSFVGEPSASAWQTGNWVVEYEEASGALSLLDCRSFADPARIGNGLDDLLARWPSAQLITATVLADKVPLIRALLGCGFELAAYLPAWYRVGSCRYDCVQVARPCYVGRPCTQDLEETLSSVAFELRLSPYLKQNAASRLSAQVHRHEKLPIIHTDPVC